MVDVVRRYKVEWDVVWLCCRNYVARPMTSMTSIDLKEGRLS